MATGPLALGGPRLTLTFRFSSYVSIARELVEVAN